jgi:hypothetical protein
MFAATMQQGMTRVRSGWPSGYAETVRQSILHALWPRSRSEGAIDPAAEALRAEIRSLQEQVAALTQLLREKPVAKSAFITDLATDGLKLAQPTGIFLDEYEEEVVASWPEVDVFATGGSPAEAILGLKGQIASLYRELIGTPDAQLGALPRSWKKVLVTVVEETGAA